MSYDNIRSIFLFSSPSCRTFVFSGTAEEKKMGHFPFFPCQFRLEMKCVISLKQEEKSQCLKITIFVSFVLSKSKQGQTDWKLMGKKAKINGKGKMRLFEVIFKQCDWSFSEA